MLISKSGKLSFSILILASLAAAGLAMRLHDGTPTTVNSVSPPSGALGVAIGADVTTAAVSPLSVPTQGSGGPILVITSTANPFSRYYAEILRTEGLNAFSVMGIFQVTAATLSAHDIVILGEMPLSHWQVAMLSDWVRNGGNLIAMRPDQKLAALLGLVDASSTLSDAYLLVDTASGPGLGIVNQPLQFHGTANLYRSSGASILATLYCDAATATSFPAVTMRRVGTEGGQAAAFAYDLARSIVYTRQGNPAWSGQERDGLAPIRSDDLFFGAANEDPKPDWIDPNKIAIPQADEQQRLLANLIIQMNFTRKPLPRFWYFPRSVKAIVIMTGDDHGRGGTAKRFSSYLAASPSGCSVEDWECIRGTSYVYSGSLSNTEATFYNSAGFEVALHIDTGCADWTPTSLNTLYEDQRGDFLTHYPGLPSPFTNRTHCIAWSDYDTQPQVEFNNGIRLDTNYYYYPSSWVSDRPGFFTGSGLPMRFAKADGTIIDVYQAATQLTDESGQTYPFTIDTLLDRAIGTEGFYGVFTVNAHNDQQASRVADAVVASARARGVPVISALQMLKWLDGRNGSSFGSLSWDGTILSFKIIAGKGANGLQAMVPNPDGFALSGITWNGTPVAHSVETVKGIRYAIFGAIPGTYQAVFARSDL
jgi:hypothetical protein